MADEPTGTSASLTPEQQAASAAAETAAAQAAASRAAETERLSALDAKISALTNTVKAALTPRPVQASADGKVQVPPQMRQLLRQGGLTDADIDANAPIVIPFLAATLATEGGAIVAEVQRVKDEVDMVKAARNGKKYPYWGDLEDEIHATRETAAKEGRYLSPDAAYHTAIASNLDKIEGARATRKAASEAADLSAQHLRNFGTSPGAQGTRCTAMSAEDIAALPREERKKLFDQLGDTPIR